MSETSGEILSYYIVLVTNLTGAFTNLVAISFYLGRYMAGKISKAIYIQIGVHLIAAVMSVTYGVAALIGISNQNMPMNVISHFLRLLYYVTAIIYYCMIMKRLSFLNHHKPGSLAMALNLPNILTERFFERAPYVLTTILLLINSPVLFSDTGSAEGSNLPAFLNLAGEILFYLITLYVAFDVTVKLSKTMKDIAPENSEFIQNMCKKCRINLALFLLLFVLIFSIEILQNQIEYARQISGGLAATAAVLFSIIFETIMKFFVESGTKEFPTPS